MPLILYYSEGMTNGVMPGSDFSDSDWTGKHVVIGSGGETYYDGSAIDKRIVKIDGEWKTFIGCNEFGEKTKQEEDARMDREGRQAAIERERMCIERFEKFISDFCTSADGVLFKCSHNFFKYSKQPYTR